MAEKKTQALAEREPNVARQVLGPLYEITGDYLDLLDAIEDQGGELDEAALAAWEQIKGDLTVKVENCGRMILALRQLAALVKEEEGRLAQRRAQLQRAERGLTIYTQQNMEASNTLRVEGALAKLRIQLNPPRCVVEDEALVPDRFCDVNVVASADVWARVVKTLLEAESVEGAAELLGAMKIARKVRSKEIIQEWKRIAGAEDVEGTHVEQASGLRVWT